MTLRLYIISYRIAIFCVISYCINRFPLRPYRASSRQKYHTVFHNDQITPSHTILVLARIDSKHSGGDFIFTLLILENGRHGRQVDSSVVAPPPNVIIIYSVGTIYRIVSNIAILASYSVLSLSR